ncbi:DUF6362 family protein [Aminobacter sp. MDW-2]|uniref:DUF6362 family protein n=1 Tax=Aminobacter sp. MDW-2 TaxID=2666139 RepID=UPI0012B0C7F4|nr:DUF6362 family protein [Aminobacter sp. MDW-2]MRX33203.1 hypothetical protein [Aminobacter sp. MDW-2]QNH36826.1 hypothetical protein H5P29_13525 [Aminobacter sp. MDW-2]
MTYQAWTAKAVEESVLEAAETLMRMPNDYRVGGGGSVWGQYKDEYGPTRTKVIVRPTGAAIDRMEKVWDWINRLPDQADRVLLYAWAWVKARRGRSINDFASREGMNVRTLRRAVTRICQLIANDLNRIQLVRLNSAVDPVSENQSELHPEQISSVSYANHWRAADAKPQHLPELLDQRPPVKRAG